MPRRSPRDFGAIKTITNKSGKKYQAFYDDPHGRTRLSRTGKPTPVRHYAPHLFVRRLDAETWLSAEEKLISSGAWTSPEERRAELLAAAEREELTFEKYATAWIRQRRNSKGQPLAAQTRDKYEGLLRRHILPAFGDRTLTSITRAAVRTWYAAMNEQTPTERAHAYNLLRSIMRTAAEDDELIQGNPVYIRGAGIRHTKKRVKPATLDQLAVMVAETPERYRLMVQLATWCALRLGEVDELRRSDIVLGKDKDGQPQGWIKVQRGVGLVRQDPETYELGPDAHWCPCRRRCLVGPPKTEAGIRDVAIPTFLIPDVRAHLLAHTAPGENGLLFPSPRDPERHLSHMTLLGRPAIFYPEGHEKASQVKRAATGFVAARAAAGCPDLDFHDLRHTGASMAGQAGASIAELMHRLGHTTPSMAMHYQHATRDRDAEIARRLSELANG